MSEQFDITQVQYQRFEFNRQEGVLTACIVSDSPVNAVDAIMHEELARVFIDLQRDSLSDIIILTANGRAFCAGGDMAWFEEQISDPYSFQQIGWDAKQIVSSQLQMEKPLICKLNGTAAGLGASIALLSDIIVADERAMIGDPHVKVGLVAGDGGALIWPQLIGYAKAKELLLTGDMLTADEAEKLGLINHVAAAGEMDAVVDRIVSKIMANPRWAVRWTKTVTNIPLRALAAQIMEASVAWEVASNTLEDRKEAVQAFVEKRKANLSGK